MIKFIEVNGYQKPAIIVDCIDDISQVRQLRKSLVNIMEVCLSSEQAKDFARSTSLFILSRLIDETTIECPDEKGGAARTNSLRQEIIQLLLQTREQFKAEFLQLPEKDPERFCDYYVELTKLVVPKPELQARIDPLHKSQEEEDTDFEELLEHFRNNPDLSNEDEKGGAV